MIWAYYISPMMYGQNAIAINEFVDKRWSAVRSSSKLANSHFVPSKYLHLIVFTFSFLQPNPDPSIPEPTVGKVLRNRGMFKEDYWYWICVGALGFSVLLNICFIIAITFLNCKQSFTILIFSSVTEIRFLSWHCFENQTQLLVILNPLLLRRMIIKRVESSPLMDSFRWGA